MIPVPLLLALAAAALYLLPLIVPKPPPPDEAALPPLPGPSVTPPPPGPPSFVEAVAAYDRLRAFVGPRQYPPDETGRICAALQTLRLALVDPPAADHFVDASKMVEASS